jgi:acetoacetate decarboxylase
MVEKIRSLLVVILLFSTSLPKLGKAQDFERTFLSSTMSPYGNPPYRYEGSRLISITFETSPDILRALVPEPLVVDPCNMISITIGFQKIVSPGPTEYHEAYISIPVSHAGTRGTYLPILYLDKVIPILGGREIWGFSKVDAEIHFEKTDGKIFARVIQNGTMLIDIVMSLGEEELVPPENSTSQPMFNVKLIPSVKKDAPPDVMQLTSITLREEKVTKLCRGEATLILGSTAFSPLGKIPVRKITDCLYTESGFILGYGEVVYDYLDIDRAKNDPTLIAHWKLDEELGSTAYDSTGNYDGDLNGNPIWQPYGGLFDGALELDGSDDYVSIPFVLNPADGSVSVFTWVKGGTPGQVIISQADVEGQSAIESGGTWLGISQSDGGLMTGLMDIFFGPLESELVVANEQWHHVGLVYDYTTMKRQLYVDGAEVAIDDDIVAGVQSTAGLYIGAGQTLNTASFFSGLIDDVRIYNAALTAEQITALAQ